MSSNQTVTVKLNAVHPGQQRVLSEARRFNVLMCGRRFGKTALGVDLCVNGALDRETWGWFAPAYKYLEEAWRELVSVLGGVPGFTKNEQEHRLTVPGGGSIECWSMDSPDPGRGRKYHGIVVDEAGLVPKLSHVFHTALRPTLADYAGKAWFLGTPKGVGDFNALWGKGQGESHDPDWASWRLPTSANPFIRASEIEAMRESMPESTFRQEILGEPLADGEHPIGLEHIQACVGPVSKEPAVVYGVDLARSVDFTVLIGIDAGGRVCRVERWKAPWGVTRTRLLNSLGSTTTHMDSTGVGDPIVEDVQRGGGRAVAHVFTARFKQQMVEKLIAAIQQRKITIPDGWLRSELDNLTATKTAVGVRYAAPDGVDDHDDGVMALALAWWGYREQQPKPKGKGRVPEDQVGEFDLVNRVTPLYRKAGDLQGKDRIFRSNLRVPRRGIVGPHTSDITGY